MFALEPGEQGKVTLAKHDGQDNAPYCIVEAMSLKQQRQFTAEFDAIYAVETGDEFCDKIKELFLKYVKSFHGYRSDDVEEAFSKEGMLEILRRMVAGNMVSYDEKKS